ncbi:TPA: hypothetical protein I7170_18905 [Vibrio vulnificus]|nr:hypothetical protein [Vibrio vulnificus]
MFYRTLVLFICAFFYSFAQASDEKVGADPFSIDGYGFDWLRQDGVTTLDFDDLGISIQHGLQREGWVREDNGAFYDQYHDVIKIEYDKKSPINPKEIRIELKYIDPDNGEFEISHRFGWNPANLNIRVEANPNMIAYGDVYDQAFSSDSKNEMIEVIFPARPVSRNSIPVISVAIVGNDSSLFESIYNNYKKKNEVHSKKYSKEFWSSERDDNYEYSITVSVVGSVGPIAKGFQVATNFDDISLSVVDGYTVGSISSFQGEIGVWDTGDLSVLSSGTSFGSSFDTPIGSLGLVSNEDGSVKGVSASFGPAIGLPVNISQFYSQELSTSAHREGQREREPNYDGEREDDDRDRNDYDREREDDDRDRDIDNRDERCDCAIETDLDTGETIQIDFWD